MYIPVLYIQSIYHCSVTVAIQSTARFKPSIVSCSIVFNVDSVCSMTWTSTVTFVEAWWNLDFQFNGRGLKFSRASCANCSQPHHKKIPRSAPVITLSSKGSTALVTFNLVCRVILSLLITNHCGQVFESFSACASPPCPRHCCFIIPFFFRHIHRS